MAFTTHWNTYSRDIMLGIMFRGSPFISSWYRSQTQFHIGGHHLSALPSAWTGGSTPQTAAEIIGDKIYDQSTDADSPVFFSVDYINHKATATQTFWWNEVTPYYSKPDTAYLGWYLALWTGWPLRGFPYPTGSNGYDLSRLNYLQILAICIDDSGTQAVKLGAENVDVTVNWEINH